MEKELYHEHLERLYQRFGRDVTFISLAQAASFCGKDRRTLMADKTFPLRRIGTNTHYDVPVINLARWLA